uniref:FLYWCH-type domain-containing protein n=1 Tax=Bursaphelenchus xylophilus TaxID=6326 RepID=A0A1I7SLX2_BURXY
MVRVPASLSPARTRSNRTYGIQHVRRNNFVMSQPNSVLAYLQSYKSDSSEEEEEVPAPTAPAPSSALPSTTTGNVILFENTSTAPSTSRVRFEAPSTSQATGTDDPTSTQRLHGFSMSHGFRAIQINDDDEEEAMDIGDGFSGADESDTSDDDELQRPSAQPAHVVQPSSIEAYESTKPYYFLSAKKKSNGEYNKKMALGGYTYLLDRTKASWICCRKNMCGGRVRIVGEAAEEVTAHNQFCAPNIERVRAEMLKQLGT